MTPTEDTCVEAMAATSSNKLMKHMIQGIASLISEELPPEVPKEVLKGISTAAHTTTFADCIAIIKTLQCHRGEFDLLLQHMSESYKALFADVGKRPLLRKNTNVVTKLKHYSVIIQAWWAIYVVHIGIINV